MAAAAIARAFWDRMRFSVDAANRLSDEEGSEAIADQMFLRLELHVVWLTTWSDQPRVSHASSSEVMETEMEVAREQLRSFRSKSPRPKQMNEVPRSQRGCDHSTDGSSGEVLLPAVCLFRDVLCDDLGSPQILTKSIEIPLSIAMQFGTVFSSADAS